MNMVCIKGSQDAGQALVEVRAEAVSLDAANRQDSQGKALRFADLDAEKAKALIAAMDKAFAGL